MQAGFQGTAWRPGIGKGFWRKNPLPLCGANRFNNLTGNPVQKYLHKQISDRINKLTQVRNGLTSDEIGILFLDASLNAYADAMDAVRTGTLENAVQTTTQAQFIELATDIIIGTTKGVAKGAVTAVAVAIAVEAVPALGTALLINTGVDAAKALYTIGKSIYYNDPTAYNEFVKSVKAFSQLPPDKIAEHIAQMVTEFFMPKCVTRGTARITDKTLDKIKASFGGKHRQNQPNKIRFDEHNQPTTTSKWKGPHGTYKDAGYHHVNSKGNKSKAPKNGQKALDNSVQIKDTSPQRIAVCDGEIVLLKQTIPGEFHGHVSKWEELIPEAQTLLYKKGLTDLKGNILCQ